MGGMRGGTWLLSNQAVRHDSGCGNQRLGALKPSNRKDPSCHVITWEFMHRHFSGAAAGSDCHDETRLSGDPFHPQVGTAFFVYGSHYVKIVARSSKI